MRTATNGLELLREDGDEETRPFGIALGWGYCAEHEWGLRELEEALRVGTHGGSGLASRRVGVSDEALGPVMGIRDWPKETVHLAAETRLAVTGRGDVDAYLDKRKSEYGPPLYKRQDGTWTSLAAAWDSAGFCVRATEPAARGFLRDLHASFLEGDVAVGLGRKRPFGNSPLTLVIVSRVPEAVVRKVEEDDLEAERLKAAADATGVVERLRAAGRTWYALSPRWTFDKSADRTGHPVMFWLNPMDQRANNHGWFTVEELDGWARGEGPVVKD